MRFSLLSLLVSFLAACALAAAPQKAVVVSYPQDTPTHVIDQAKDAIKKAGGIITHEFSLIKGFAANAPEKILNKIQAMDSKYSAVIEDDKMVQALDSDND